MMMDGREAENGQQQNPNRSQATTENDIKICCTAENDLHEGFGVDASCNGWMADGDRGSS